MKVIKYIIKLTDYFTLQLPLNAKILCCQTQKENPCLWILCDPEAELEDRNFRLAGTGHSIDEDILDLIFIDSFQIYDGMQIYHLFEIKNSWGG